MSGMVARGMIRQSSLTRLGLMINTAVTGVVTTTTNNRKAAAGTEAPERYHTCDWREERRRDQGRSVGGREGLTRLSQPDVTSLSGREPHGSCVQFVAPCGCSLR
ncbi:hypothetical protein E2C01_054855 [Portunus trituberculatus]|uniref:Uncharacterized protein n=1 Tax=Portunus trituberculatus TaxID=210409 RepID=A0A5B7GTB0_PORTR|nr:hypothetical protein [Portunus trituberculatus]